jgi:hypothetical protein
MSMNGSEVIQVDGVIAFEHGEAILERPIRHAVLVGGILVDVHLLHVRLRVLVRDDLDVGWEEHVAARVIAVGMRIDDHRHRFVGD